MHKWLGVMLVSATLGTAACGAQGGAPAAPSNGGASLTGAALVSGTIRNASPSGTVSVAGTGMTAGLDAAGHFAVSVPTGDVRLQVNSGGANAMVAIAAVQPAETIEIVVSVSGASANVESEVRHGAGQAELHAIVDALPPTTAASTFRAAGKIVITNASTAFANGSFASLAVGTHVEVQGTLAGDSITATRVEIEDAPRPPAPNPAPPRPEPVEAEFTGTISALSGTAASFQFTVGTRVVKGDATTAIGGDGSSAKSFADLANGGMVEVKGVQQNGFVQATRIHLEGQETEPGDNHDETELEGALGAVSGTCPAITASVGGTRFITSAATRFDGAACSAFKSGDQVEVKGTKNADGSVAASRLEEKR